ncbi:hypothetical protein [Rhodococcus sp. ABRD24]|uniref:hypothetical protein n=1 Tax=Rhodococcus sp. ABRD24 TaxID=2507582 RepID=UPI001F604210|nr:hypothetical protein [Rhodococcus sp. ABRD24]
MPDSSATAWMDMALAPRSAASSVAAAMSRRRVSSEISCLRVDAIVFSASFSIAGSVHWIEPVRVAELPTGTDIYVIDPMIG